ncbi:unnamed protein product [Peronospora farinosa]|uniref:Glycoside hydrolase family 19 catalytic domain-containing protein n=1 Tax=Peronospora farinosa TaxID=134698 RepID=A0AAV0T428_9STRA|nr:unnamed protein product [Peronospora farinosa]CAI5712225.1 unnamed protein product [Peronospora farinosa]
MNLSRVIASLGLLGVAAADSNEVVKCPTEQPTPTVTPAMTTTSTSSSFARFFDQSKFKNIFPDAVELYNFNGLVNAASKYPTFANTGNDVNDRRELAAFFAQTAHESDNFKAAEEYAKDTYSVWQYCDNTTYPCAPGRRYHGRGPIQLSWNYNYYNAGKALNIDLLNNPDIVAKDTAVTWMTALWYWMTPQKNGRIIHNVVTIEGGFAQSTDIINGGLECGPDAPNKKNEEQRIKYYAKMCEVLNVQPLGISSCNA